MRITELDEIEMWWRDRQEWLQTCGYMLRPRFRVGWQGPANKEEELWKITRVMDATRISDGAMVALKRLSLRNSTTSAEERIMSLLNSEPLASHPDNPCPELYDVLTIPGTEGLKILVLPFFREIDDPPFETIGEVMDFCRQALYGLRFLHEHDIAHRDTHSMNIMLDPRGMYPNGFYPGDICYKDRSPDFSTRAKFYTRTQRPPRYYWIDYGLSGVFRCSNRSQLRVPYIWGGDKDIPETQKKWTVANPFATDVWWVGNLIQTELIQRYTGLEHLTPLVAAMCQERPEDRSTIVAAAAIFDAILAQCSTRQLRSFTMRRKNWFGRFLQGFPGYMLHTAEYRLTGKPALPVRKNGHEEKEAPRSYT
ncbi:hypothetical protein C8F01DRAFT_1247197 [Mycena amicta]|nr:hypothetical protein C8F01DRAFT_1247197 [Mycena amicta]